MLGYPGLAVVGELGSDVAMWPWFLLVVFLCLPFAIWLSLVLLGNISTQFSHRSNSWVPQHTRKARVRFKITSHDADRGLQKGLNNSLKEIQEYESTGRSPYKVNTKI